MFGIAGDSAGGDVHGGVAGVVDGDDDDVADVNGVARMRVVVCVVGVRDCDGSGAGDGGDVAVVVVVRCVYVDGGGVVVVLLLVVVLVVVWMVCCGCW